MGDERQKWNCLEKGGYRVGDFVGDERQKRNCLAIEERRYSLFAFLKENQKILG